MIPGFGMMKKKEKYYLFRLAIGIHAVDWEDNTYDAFGIIEDGLFGKQRQTVD